MSDTPKRTVFFVTCIRTTLFNMTPYEILQQKPQIITYHEFRSSSNKLCRKLSGLNNTYCLDCPARFSVYHIFHRLVTMISIDQSMDPLLLMAIDFFSWRLIHYTNEIHLKSNARQFRITTLTIRLWPTTNNELINETLWNSTAEYCCSSRRRLNCEQ